MGRQVIDPSYDVPPVLPGVTQATGVGTAVLGLTALIGWAFRAQVLKQFMPGLVSMRPSTAVCLILLGVAVSMLVRRPRRLWLRQAAIAGAGLIASISLLEYALDRDLLVDRLLFRDAVDRELYGGRMALATAVSLILMALALLATSCGKPQAAQGLGLLVFAGG